MGLPVELVGEAANYQELSIYPDNALIVRVFRGMLTQWYVGMNGPTGLNYSSLPFVFSTYGVEDVTDTFEGLQTMERAALKRLRAR